MNTLFPSVYNAIRDFLIANVIRDIRDPFPNTHRSMLVNMSRFTKVHEGIQKKIREYIDEVKRWARQTEKMCPSKALQNPRIKELKDTFDKDFKDQLSNSNITWEMVFGKLYESIKNIEVVVVNSSKNATPLKYSDHATNGYRVIAIGGLALSRGLTLEGLMTSYFYRNTATYDVLMQMGRWFGYRNGYEELVRIYMNKDSADYYKEISEAISDLRTDIKKMCEQNKTPLEYGIRVRSYSDRLHITSASKMRNAVTTGTTIVVIDP